MKRVTVASRIAGFCSLTALFLCAGPVSATEVGIGTLIFGKWEMVSGPQGHPKWDVEFTRAGEVLVYAEGMTLKGKFKILDNNTIETEIRSLVDPKKVTFTKLGIKVNFGQLTIKDGNDLTTYRRFKAPAPVNPDTALRQHLKRQVEELQRAAIRGDFAKVADLTHAKVIEELGGRDTAITEMKAVMQQLKDKGWSFQLKGIELPTEFATAGKELYVVVPFKLEVTAPDLKIKQDGFVVGVSPDKGKTWTFVDGNNHEELRRLLPELPRQLRLPQAQMHVEKVQ